MRTPKKRKTRKNRKKFRMQAGPRWLNCREMKNEPDLPFRKSGCAALDMAYVASGRYDGYFQKKLNLWDIAAGILIVKEAGGIVNDIDLSINKNINIIASSADINSKLLKKLNNF